MTTTLSKTEIDNYWNDGYLFPKRVMSVETANALRIELEQLEAD